MHNKLLLADGALALAGGRNLTAEYFMRAADGNFLDFDFLITGALVPQLAELFDTYWNHPRVLNMGQLTAHAENVSAQQAAFAAWAAQAPSYQAPSQPDLLGHPSLTQAMATGEPTFRPGRARAFADPPGKTFDQRAPKDAPQAGSTLAWVESLAYETQRESLLISPYFLPDERMRQRLKEAAARGVKINVLSNSLATSDEPLVAYAASRHRVDLLAAGLQLYEATHTLRLDGNSLRWRLQASGPAGELTEDPGLDAWLRLRLWLLYLLVPDELL